MDLFTLGAALLGLAGVVLGLLAWQQAREVKSIAERALQEAKRVRPAVAEAPHPVAPSSIAAETVVQPAPDRSTELAKPPPVPHHAEQSAHIVVRAGSADGRELPTNQGTGSGLIGIFLVNDGPAVAHDLQLHAIFPNGVRRSSELHRTLTAHKELTLYAQVVPADFGADDPLNLLYQIAYRDGNGAQSFERDVRLEGGWKGPWKTSVNVTSNDHIEA